MHDQRTPKRTIVSFLLDRAGCMNHVKGETVDGVHVSGIGADERSTSPYIRSRGQGEEAVLKAFPAAHILRPAVMFGPGDAFLLPLLAMLRRMPVFPMFGTGETKLQPVYVEDVGEASTRVLQSSSSHRVYELAGPRIYTYRALVDRARSARSPDCLRWRRSRRGDPALQPSRLRRSSGYGGSFLAPSRSADLLVG